MGLFCVRPRGAASRFPWWKAGFGSEHPQVRVASDIPYGLCTIWRTYPYGPLTPPLATRLKSDERPRSTSVSAINGIRLVVFPR